MIGGLSTYDLLNRHRGDKEELELVGRATGLREYLLPPLPNTLYTRDTTSWIYNGVTLNPLYWQARREETLLTTAIYKFHPDFTRQTINTWWEIQRVITVPPPLKAAMLCLLATRPF